MNVYRSRIDVTWLGESGTGRAEWPAIFRALKAAGLTIRVVEEARVVTTIPDPPVVKLKEAK